MFRVVGLFLLPLMTGCLVHAAGSGDPAAVERRLRKGAKPDQTDAQGITALGAAIMAGDEASVRLLLEAGADPNLATHGRREKGRSTPVATALHSMWWLGRHQEQAETPFVPILRALLAKGASPDSRDGTDEPALHLAIRCMDGTSPGRGHDYCFKAAQMLIEHGADLGAVFEERTALDAALLADPDIYGETHELVRMIVAKGGEGDLDLALVATVKRLYWATETGGYPKQVYPVVFNVPPRIHLLLTLGAKPEAVCAQSFKGREQCALLTRVVEARSRSGRGQSGLLAAAFGCAVEHFGEDACNALLDGGPSSSLSCKALMVAAGTVELEDAAVRVLGDVAKHALSQAEPGMGRAIEAIERVGNVISFARCLSGGS